ncbi:ABC transporter permease [Micropruina sp.]|uniref:ABC transporter permease n=1 Tax=Micropruina sp. TaxID=2737536 RepID=UPI0039E61903
MPTRTPRRRVSTRSAGGGGVRPTPLAVTVWTLAVLVPVGFLAVFFAWPVAALVAKGFVTDGGLSLEGVRGVLSTPRTWRIIGQTLGQAIAGTAAAVLLGVPGAYLLYRCRFPGREFVRALVSVPFVLPTVVVGVAFRSLFASTGPLGWLGLDETFAAIVVALVFFNYSVIVRTVGALWARLDPRAAEVALVLGASPVRVFCTVTLPALAPAIVSGASLVFLFCATAFGIVMVMGGVSFSTIETEIWYQTTQLLDLPAAAALSVVQLVVVAGSLLAAGRARRRSEHALTLRGDAGAEQQWRLARDLVPTIVTAVVVAGLLLTPLLHVVVRSFVTAEGWGWRNYALLATTGGGSLSVPVWTAVANSLAIAVQASALALSLGVLVSLIASRRPRHRGLAAGVTMLDALFMLPLGVSAVTVGFGFLITLNRPPFDLRSSPVLIPIAQAIVALPLVVRTLLPVLRAIEPRQREAAAMLGAGPGRVLASIDGVLALRGLGLAAGFAFATSLGEFGATSFLSRPDHPTLPVVIFRLIGRPGADNFGMALAAAAVLAVLTTAVMAAAELVRPREAEL